MIGRSLVSLVRVRARRGWRRRWPGPWCSPRRRATTAARSARPIQILWRSSPRRSPRSPRSSPPTPRSSSARSPPPPPSQSRSCCSPASSTGCANGGTPTPTKFTGDSNGDDPGNTTTTANSSGAGRPRPLAILIAAAGDFPGAGLPRPGFVAAAWALPLPPGRAAREVQRRPVCAGRAAALAQVRSASDSGRWV